ncbi:winged helix-turn-helix transcriptional regulator [Singulisphaera rosea]
MVSKARPDGVSVEDCPLHFMFELLGDKWTLALLYLLSQGVHRYGELQRLLHGISKKMLTQTLRSMEADGLVERTVYAVVPPKTEYKLTSLGSKLFEPLEHLGDWAGDHRHELRTIQARRTLR